MNGQMTEGLFDEQDGVVRDVIGTAVIHPKKGVILFIVVDERTVVDAGAAKVVVGGDGHANGPGEQQHLRDAIHPALL